MPVTYRVYHNVARDEHGRHLGFSGYRDGQPMVLVWERGIAGLAHEREFGGDARQVAEYYFRVFNLDPADLPADGTGRHEALAYRRRGNRALSVGDVVVVAYGDGERETCEILACASAGWENITSPLRVLPGTGHEPVPGTTPYQGWPPVQPFRRQRSAPGPGEPGPDSGPGTAPGPGF